jgi:hypothetical protein
MISSRRSNPIDLLTVDVEGADLGVPRGRHGVLDRCRLLVLFESGPVRCGALRLQ